MKHLARSRILLVDDDLNFQRVTSYTLTQFGATVTTASHGREALSVYERESFDLILSDVKMPEMDGLVLLAETRKRDPEIPFILITAHGDIEMAVEAMQSGATDFITKPFDRQRLLEKLQRALRVSQLERENQALREELTTRHTFENIIGSSPAMRQLYDLMRRVSQRDTTVLILGESGTGKELVAKALHYNGPRHERRFVAVNCAAIPLTLLESELFGHAKGAFTGANAAREGRFQTASGGTIFLDEVGDMPLELQAKLLRVLQEKQIEPVGSGQSIRIDVRIIAATNKNLEKLVRNGEFREDLFYRLNVVPLHAPPLRDRREDIPLLVKHFLNRFHEPHIGMEKEAMTRLMAYHWPGNVRELENTIERALALRAKKDRIIADDIHEYTHAPPPHSDYSCFEIPDEGIVLDDLEKRMLESAIRKTGGNQTRAAQLLGITRQTLIYRMQKHEIS